MNRNIGIHVGKVIDQINHLYKSSYYLRRESVEICKEVENNVADRDMVVAGFLLNFRKLLIKPDNTFDSTAFQLRTYGFSQNITMPIWLMKYIGRNDPIARMVKTENQWYHNSQILHNTQLIVEQNLKQQGSQTKLNTHEWDKYLSEVYASLYRSSLQK